MILKDPNDITFKELEVYEIEVEKLSGHPNVLSMYQNYNGFRTWGYIVRGAVTANWFTNGVTIADVDNAPPKQIHEKANEVMKLYNEVTGADLETKKKSS